MSGTTEFNWNEYQRNYRKKRIKENNPMPSQIYIPVCGSTNSYYQTHSDFREREIKRILDKYHNDPEFREKRKEYQRSYNKKIKENKNESRN